MKFRYTISSSYSRSLSGGPKSIDEFSQHKFLCIFEIVSFKEFCGHTLLSLIYFLDLLGTIRLFNKYFWAPVKFFSALWLLYWTRLVRFQCSGSLPSTGPSKWVLKLSEEHNETKIGWHDSYLGGGLCFLGWMVREGLFEEMTIRAWNSGK